jgi:glycolate oxidase
VTIDFVTNEEIIQAARRRLTQGEWDYLVGGAESETSLRRNRLAYDRVAFRPRVLVDVTHIDTSSTLLGHKLRIPALLAPIGSLEAFDPEGAVASAKAAAEFGVLPVVSTATRPDLEVSAASTEGPKVFQLYVRGDLGWIRDILGRVKESGYASLCLTVDMAVYSRRERPLVSRYSPPSRRDRSWQASVTWELMDKIKEIGGLPFMVKGIQTAEDARIAVEHGVDVVWVSNHGGRQLDHTLGTLDMLPEIVEAVDGRAEIVVDGGIQRGSDIVKAVAMGAKAVSIGKLQCWGLAAAGKDGVVRVLEILEQEMMASLGLMGVNSLDQITPAYLTRGEPVVMPHEMSAWVNLPGGRV